MRRHFEIESEPRQWAASLSSTSPTGDDPVDVIRPTRRARQAAPPNKRISQTLQVSDEAFGELETIRPARSLLIVRPVTTKTLSFKQCK